MTTTSSSVADCRVCVRSPSRRRRASTGETRPESLSRTFPYVYMPRIQTLIRDYLANVDFIYVIGLGEDYLISIIIMSGGRGTYRFIYTMGICTYVRSASISDIIFLTSSLMMGI